jgi:hypothetical protein
MSFVDFTTLALQFLCYVVPLSLRKIPPVNLFATFFASWPSER